MPEFWNHPEIILSLNLLLLQSEMEHTHSHIFIATVQLEAAAFWTLKKAANWKSSCRSFRQSFGSRPDCLSFKKPVNWGQLLPVSHCTLATSDPLFLQSHRGIIIPELYCPTADILSQSLPSSSLAPSPGPFLYFSDHTDFPATCCSWQIVIWVLDWKLISVMARCFQEKWSQKQSGWRVHWQHLCGESC